MKRRGVPSAWYLGGRRLLALTCWACGKLKQAADYERSSKGGYIDRRCRACRWRVMESSPGR